MENIILNNGVEIPSIGFGTYRSGEAKENIISLAIEAGYRYFDTASFYNNYNDLLLGIEQCNITRSDLFLSSKCWRTEMGYKNAMKSFHNACINLNTSYLDMFLIHWPRPNLIDAEWKSVSRDTWRALEDLYKAGKVRAIGVSNFLIEHLDNLLSTAEIIPAVNQIEFHPGYTQKEVVSFSEKSGIRVQGWSPLGCGRLLENQLLLKLAEKYEVSLPQICLRYAYQKNIIPLPKASSIIRMKNNLDIFGFVISEDDLNRIDNMPVTAWSGEHPDYERVRF